MSRGSPKFRQIVTGSASVSILLCGCGSRPCDNTDAAATAQPRNIMVYVISLSYVMGYSENNKEAGSPQ